MSIMAVARWAALFTDLRKTSNLWWSQMCSDRLTAQKHHGYFVFKQGKQAPSRMGEIEKSHEVSFRKRNDHGSPIVLRRQQ